MLSSVLFLLACSSVALTLSLPVAPPAENAVSLPLRDLLTPTVFGASDDVLCPWARGDPAASASIPRWLAEGRLTWRVLRPEEPATFAGQPLAEGRAVIEALEAVETRCGAEPGPRNYLIAASGTTLSGAVTKGMYEVGKLQFDEPWCLVSDATPAPAPPGRVAAGRGVPKLEAPAVDPTPGDTGTPRRSRLLDLLGAVGESPPPEPEYFTIVVQDPPKLLSSRGEVDEPWRPWLLAKRPVELVVAAPDAAPWASVVSVMDAAQGVDSAVVLAMLIEDEREPLPQVEISTQPAATVVVPWNAEVAVLPIAVPRYR